MKRKYGLLLTLCMILVLTGCGSAGAKAGDSSEASQSGREASETVQSGEAASEASQSGGHAPDAAEALDNAA